MAMTAFSAPGCATLSARGTSHPLFFLGPSGPISRHRISFDHFLEGTNMAKRPPARPPALALGRSM